MFVHSMHTRIQGSFSRTSLSNLHVMHFTESRTHSNKPNNERSAPWKWWAWARNCVEASAVPARKEHLCRSWQCWHRNCRYVCKLPVLIKRVRVCACWRVCGDIRCPCVVCGGMMSVCCACVCLCWLPRIHADKTKNVSLSFANNFKEVIDFVKQHEVSVKRTARSRGHSWSRGHSADNDGVQMYFYTDLFVFKCYVFFSVYFLRLP